MISQTRLVPGIAIAPRNPVSFTTSWHRQATLQAGKGAPKVLRLRKSILKAGLGIVISTGSALSIVTPAGAQPSPPATPKATSAATGKVVAGQNAAGAWKSWTWGFQHVGDCSMFEGATWTINDDGTAHFAGWVTSSDTNDTWRMRLVLLDGSGREIDTLIGGPPDAPEWFSLSLPDPRYRYHWGAWGSYRGSLFPAVQGMRMYSRC
ncbi:DUF6294 family protein [Actinomadura fulvescens]|uniref:DUF6294 family protein n=1 Tax=Actinomadura fulvescens TaxID=46160 RepID=UPI0031D34B06